MIKNRIVYSPFLNWRFNVSKSEGCYLFDADGRRYIDFTSGWNVANLGWNQPEVNEAAAGQMKQNAYNPMWTGTAIQESLAGALTKSLPPVLNAVCRSTGGSEANEVALKIARAATGRKKILSFRDGYHGQTMADISLCYRPEYVREISPLIPEIVQIDFPTSDLDDFLTRLEELLAGKEFAALVTEPGIITGGGSVSIAPKGYIAAVRDQTRKYGTLLVVDEVGAGFSRLGKLFGFELEGIVPDIVTFAKGITNGAGALGATVTSADLVNPIIPKIKLCSTFGWLPSACAAALKTLEIHQRDRVFEKSSESGENLKRLLHKSLNSNPRVSDIRGIGMEIGLELVGGEDRDGEKAGPTLADKIVEQSFQKGLHLVCNHVNVIQIMPPLTTPSPVLEEGANILADVIKSCTK